MFVCRERLSYTECLLYLRGSKPSSVFLLEKVPPNCPNPASVILPSAGKHHERVVKACHETRLSTGMSTEVLTQLQDQLHVVSQMFFDFVGILQRDAPPKALDQEAVNSTSNLDVEEAAQLMSQQLIEQFQVTEGLIKCIPVDNTSEEQQYERIRALQTEHQQACKDLAEAVENAEQLLEQLQHMYAALIEHKLQSSSSKQ